VVAGLCAPLDQAEQRWSRLFALVAIALVVISLAYQLLLRLNQSA
jgi:hypothetical protein